MRLIKAPANLASAARRAPPCSAPLAGPFFMRDDHTAAPLPDRRVSGPYSSRGLPNTLGRPRLREALSPARALSHPHSSDLLLEDVFSQRTNNFFETLGVTVTEARVRDKCGVRQARILHFGPS